MAQDKYKREVLEAEVNAVADAIESAYHKSSLTWTDFCDLVIAYAQHNRLRFGPIKLDKAQNDRPNPG